MALIRIGFKSGSELKVQAQDADKFFRDMAALIKKTSPTAMQWYSEPGVLLLVNDIVFIIQEPA